MSKLFSTRSLTRGLTFALALQLAGLPAPAQTLPTSLTIITVEGDNATGRIRQQPDHVPVVRVVDQNQQPVSGSAVVFTLPTEGATGVFGNGGKTLMVVTGADGTAAAKGFRFNQIPGKVPVSVNVSYKGLTSRANIVLSSQAPAGYKPPKSGGGGHGHTGVIIAVIAVLAAGGAGGAVYAMRGKSSTPTPTTVTTPPIGITAGTATLAPPR